MVDALASGASGGNPVEVQVLFSAPSRWVLYMIPSNVLIPQSMRRFFHYFIGFMLIAIMTIDNGHAMSEYADEPSSTNPYLPSEWHENANPEVDAALALDNNDHRLLAFALRATNIPGIKPEQIKAYSEHCGLRFLKNFGDVIHSEEELNKMKQAREYALRYNAMITSKCNLSE